MFAPSILSVAPLATLHGLVPLKLDDVLRFMLGFNTAVPPSTFNPLLERPNIVVPLNVTVPGPSM
jgi:hypothetical protein